MAGRPPAGDPAPPDGTLPASALAGLGSRPFGFYLHVPFCRSRCGYCDFNTYTAAELVGTSLAISPATHRGYLADEIRLARRVLGSAELPVSSVFLGGGTPTLMAPADVGAVLAELRESFGLAPGAEVTIEANPDSVDSASLLELRRVGCNRISFGMQSAVPRVLEVLERTHEPGAVDRAVVAARMAGFESVSLDLIYGAPGETLAEWQTTIGACLALAPDHISAYALIVEEGTRLHTAIRRGERGVPDDDLMADMYLAADAAFTAAGLGWYELSNWARPGQECRHNLGYWHSADWWGAGPGAHSHIGGVRWWNLRHPVTWATRLAQGESPAQAREVLDAKTRAMEQVMLQSRLASGMELRTDGQRWVATELVDSGLATRADVDRVVLTARGRLLADAIVLRML